MRHRSFARGLYKMIFAGASTLVDIFDGLGRVTYDFPGNDLLLQIPCDVVANALNLHCRL
jgi:hypothetical protein